MRVSRLLIFLLIALILPCTLFSQEEKGEEEKKGKLKGFGEEFTGDKDSDEEEDEGESGGFSIAGFLDVVDLVEAIANSKPGPFPYNKQGSNFRSGQNYPGGIVKLYGAYFRHSDDLYGFSWRYSYYRNTFGVEADMYNLVERLDNRTDHLDFAGARAGWDFLARNQFHIGAQFGARTLVTDESSPSGPELGLRLLALPAYPLILQAQGSVAWINGKSLTTLTTSLGVMLWRFEIFWGGQLFKAPGASIDGWNAGLRIWL